MANLRELNKMLVFAENRPYLKIGLKNDDKYKTAWLNRINEIKCLIKLKELI